MKTFALLPHEVPPGCTAPLEAEADCVFEWENEEVLVREVKLKPSFYVLFLRRANLNWVACSHHSLLIRRKPLEKRKIERAVLNHLRTAITLGRIFFLSKRIGEELPTALITPDNSGSWLDSAGQRASYFPFNFSSPTLADLELEFFDDSSEVAFSWFWRNLDWSARRAFIWGEVAEQVREAEAVMTWVLQSWASLWETNFQVTWLTDESGYCHLAASELMSGQVPMNHPFGEVWNAFWSENTPHEVFDKWAERHLCINRSRHTGFIVVNVEKPTFHEQIEARLNLEKWLDQNASPQLKAQLLPPVT